MDSFFWKTKLLSAASRIKRVACFKRYSERRANEFEWEIMSAIFSVRTLIERRTLSEELLTETVAVTAHPKRTKKLTTRLNAHDFDELFDLAAPQPRNVDLEFFCNQIIHSYIFAPVRTTRRFTHFLFCSDFQRNEFLFLAEVCTLEALLRKVAADAVVSTEWTFNPQLKRPDYDIRNRTVLPDEAI